MKKLIKKHTQTVCQKKSVRETYKAQEIKGGVEKHMTGLSNYILDIV